MKRKWRAIGKVLNGAILAAVVLVPVVVLIATGSVGSLSAIYAAEVLLGLAVRYAVRRLGLPSWSASEAYITRLRAWRANRRAGSGAPPGGLPS
jgi:hypothetical protein